MLVDINLMPKKEKRNYKALFVYVSLTLLTLLLIGSSALLYWLNHQDLQRVEGELNQQQEVNQAIISEFEGDAEQQQTRAVQEILEDLQVHNTSLSSVLEKALNHLPRQGSLNAFQYNDSHIDLTIQTNTNEQAVEYYQALRESESFESVTIHTINFVESEDYFTTNYTVQLPIAEEGDES
ncbi:hypothetical protein [Aquisalibacillus elongatus]|uniref:Tfp pilus assembly protein PilN n=1 Tax=Aquisalibacillus elongatus TaxID=485577 RepID=A0A3N5BLJ3_9BACI|nr:hypothetical protein [Aquisalibacillus elongatus]RPF50558.1 Tfp pilus assembly protein PilN [Aquisalibacillus elongatus]